MHSKYMCISLGIKEVIGGKFSCKEDTTIYSQNYI